MKMKLAIATAIMLGAAGSQDIPRDASASPWLQKKANYLEAMAHFSQSAVSCGLWSQADQQRFQTRYEASTVPLPPGDMNYAMTLYLEGVVRGKRQFAEDQAAECSALRYQNTMRELQSLASGSKPFWPRPDEEKGTPSRWLIEMRPLLVDFARRLIAAHDCGIWGYPPDQIRSLFNDLATREMTPADASFAKAAFDDGQREAFVAGSRIDPTACDWSHPEIRDEIAMRLHTPIPQWPERK